MSVEVQQDGNVALPMVSPCVEASASLPRRVWLVVGLLQVSGNSILWRPRVVYTGHSATTSIFLVLGHLALVGPKIGSKQGFLQLGLESVWPKSSFKEQVLD